MVQPGITAALSNMCLLVTGTLGNWHQPTLYVCVILLTFSIELIHSMLSYWHSLDRDVIVWLLV